MNKPGYIRMLFEGTMGSERDIESVISEARKICHDINQPLTVIMARSELMMLKMGENDPNRKAVDQIHEQADKMSNLVEKLRNLLKEFQEG